LSHAGFGVTHQGVASAALQVVPPGQGRLDEPVKEGVNLGLHQEQAGPERPVVAGDLVAEVPQPRRLLLAAGHLHQEVHVGDDLVRELLELLQHRPLRLR
jgi:hypothetical protein